ncbi:MAG: hypothetical protein H3C55_15800 [Pseudorhodoplanes sp.]|nr:hypothetical protein [Pseudorhodoplanes sp.]
MLVSQAEWARRRGFSRQYVSKLVATGVIRLVDGLIEPEVADRALEARRELARPARRSTPPTGMQTSSRPSPQAARASSSRLGSDLAELSGADLPTILLKARTKTEVEKGKLLELKAKVEAGKFVDADEVNVAAFNKARIVRDALLNIASRLAPLVAAESNERACFDLIDREIRQALEELAGPA